MPETLAERIAETPRFARYGRVTRVVGLVIERVVMRPMLGEPVFATVMVTIGLAVILRSSINFIWDAYPHGLDVGFGRTIVRIGPIGVRTGQIAVIATLLVLLAAIWAFFRYSK